MVLKSWGDEFAAPSELADCSLPLLGRDVRLCGGSSSGPAKAGVSTGELTSEEATGTLSVRSVHSDV